MRGKIYQNCLFCFLFCLYSHCFGFGRGFEIDGQIGTNTPAHCGASNVKSYEEDQTNTNRVTGYLVASVRKEQRTKRRPAIKMESKRTC